MNPLKWLLAGYRAGKRLDALKKFREQHEGSYVTTDERVMQALTYPTQAAARERMHINFSISNLSVVSAAVATAASTFGFGPTQQAFGLYWLNHDETFTSKKQFEETLHRVAGDDMIWYGALRQFIGPARINNNY